MKTARGKRSATRAALLEQTAVESSPALLNFDFSTAEEPGRASSRRSAAEPSTIKDAIIRWLEEQL